MEKQNSEAQNGGLKLPIGWRFLPTDEEVLAYLKRKVCSLPFPANVIPELDVFQSNPWELPGDLKEKKYFFGQRKSNCISKCTSSLLAGCGYWKATGREKQIVAPGTNIVIGMKRSFVFYKVNQRSGGTKTPWIMQEFCLVGYWTSPYFPQKLTMQVGDWNVCHIYQRKQKAQTSGINNIQKTNSKRARNFQNFRPSDDRILINGDSSSCSSGVTEISCEGPDQEENSH